MRVGKNKAVALLWRGDAGGSGRASRATEQESPTGGGVADDRGVVCCKVRENVGFCASMGCVIADHEGVENVIIGHPADELAIVARHADTPDLTFLLQFVQFSDHSRWQLARLENAQEEEAVDGIDPELSEPFFEGLPHTLVGPDKIVCAGDEVQAFAIAPKNLPQRPNHLQVESVSEKDVHTSVESVMNGFPSRPIGGRESHAQDSGSVPSEGC